MMVAANVILTYYNGMIQRPDGSVEPVRGVVAQAAESRYRRPDP
jgi:hypothetical protein